MSGEVTTIELRDLFRFRAKGPPKRIAAQLELDDTDVAALVPLRLLGAVSRRPTITDRSSLNAVR
jgi:hypothetical protein